MLDAVFDADPEGWNKRELDGVPLGFSTCLRVCTFTPPRYIGMLVVAGLFGMLALWWFWLYIVCFMHVSQKHLRSKGEQNELSDEAEHRGRRATA